MKGILKFGFWSLVLLAALTGGYAYWQKITLYPSTDDAYVKTNVIHLSPYISGHVKEIFVKDNELVKKGTLLYTIDSRPYLIALNKARATIDICKQAIESNKDFVEIAPAKVKQAKAQYQLVKKTAVRTNTLVKQGKLSVAAGDTMSTTLSVSQSTLYEAESRYKQALVNLGKAGEQNAKLRQAKANLKQALLNLRYTRVASPADGKITHFSLREGDMVHQGPTALTVIEQKEFWIEANFKETQLGRIKIGQNTDVELDMFPGKVLHGVVESISGGTGASFSILPQENASGNWVKVTQRIPVRISLKNVELPLALGQSATATVDTTKNA